MPLHVGDARVSRKNALNRKSLVSLADAWALPEGNSTRKPAKMFRASLYARVSTNDQTPAIRIWHSAASPQPRCRYMQTRV
jgi:hypothetical protein